MTDADSNRPLPAVAEAAAVPSTDGIPTDELFSRVYDELRRLAHHLVAAFPGATQPTGIVHAVWLELRHIPGFRDEQHFKRTVARAMHWFLIDQARRQRTAIRGGGKSPVPLSASMNVAAPAVQPEVILAVHELLAKLPDDEREYLELRWFLDLPQEEAAEVCGMSRHAGNRLWNRLKHVLALQLSSGQTQVPQTR